MNTPSTPTPTTTQPTSSRFHLPPVPRSRAAVVVALLTPVLLLVHGYDGPGRDFMHVNGWTLFMPIWWYFLLQCVWQKGRTLSHVAVVAAICVAVEFSQSITAPWIENARPMPLGRLLLGRGFDAWDFVLYMVGLDLALVIHLWHNKKLMMNNE